MLGRAMVWWRRCPVGLAVATATLLGGCIIPDTDIQVRPDFVNPGPVRIVQAVPVSDQANDACDAAAVELQECPLLPPSVPFGLLGADTTFCVCPDADNNALLSFDLYVEDPDADDAGNPVDTLLGVLLLDMPSSAEDPSQYVAYTNLLSGTEPATNVKFGFGGYQDSLERPTPLVRSWTLGRDSGVDLCNGSGVDLRPGVHSLRVVVTDRPWYRPVLRDDDGEPVFDRDIPLRVDDETSAKIGVPDTPAGASYAIADYVFACGDGTDPDNPSPGCNCALPEPQ